jgi:ribonuclease T1
MKLRNIARCAAFILFASLSVLPFRASAAQSCEKVVQELNSGLSSKIDEQELVEILHSLNHTGNKHLPEKFVTKQQAKLKGWRPGKDLWSVQALRGTSLGGDRFWNREALLPDKNWREADLDYKGGRRGAKRLVFSRDGERSVTVDHYKSFSRVNACQ